MIPYQRNESLGLDYESGTKGHYNFGKLQEESARQQINMHKNERRGGEDFNTFVETVSLILPYLVYQHSYTEAPDSHGLTNIRQGASKYWHWHFMCLCGSKII